MTFRLKVLLQVLNFASVIASGLMIWKGLGIITNSESPIVVVLRCVFKWLRLPEPPNSFFFDLQWIQGTSFLPWRSSFLDQPREPAISNR